MWEDIKESNYYGLLVIGAVIFYPLLGVVGMIWALAISEWGMVVSSGFLVSKNTLKRKHYNGN